MDVDVQEICLSHSDHYTTESRTALPPIQWVPGSLPLRVKRPGREADHSPPSSAEVKEWVEQYVHSPNTPTWRGAQLKHRDNFTFLLKYVTEFTSLMFQWWLLVVMVTSLTIM